jgi:hypothetical protein
MLRSSSSACVAADDKESKGGKGDSKSDGKSDGKGESGSGGGGSSSGLTHSQTRHQFATDLQEVGLPTPSSLLLGQSR